MKPNNCPLCGKAPSVRVDQVLSPCTLTWEAVVFCACQGADRQICGYAYAPSPAHATAKATADYHAIIADRIANPPSGYHYHPRWRALRDGE